MSTADVGSVATAGGVFLLAAQLVYARRQTRTALEDQLSREYREIARELPPAAFLDRPDPDDPDGLPPVRASREPFARYFDLSNQQVFLRQERRISKKTWEMWSDGIKDNLTREGFRAAWEYTRVHSPRSYNELARLYHPSPDHRRWRRDPAYWIRRWWRLGAWMEPAEPWPPPRD